MSAPLTKRTTDHSDKESFSFSFYCDYCGKEWRSPAMPFTGGGLTEIEHEEARQMIWAHEHNIAFERANVEAITHFNLCPQCGKRVCDDCFNFETANGQMCKKCSEE